MSSPSDNNALIILLQIVMFLEDYQLTNTTFLQTVSSLLSGGEISSLYSSDELQVGALESN